MIHDIEQNTDEWFQLRMGLITASNFAAVMAFPGKPFGKGALDYAMKVAIESKTKRMIETYQNDYMERGKILEAEAREVYEHMTFSEVHPGGIAISGRFGASADGQMEDNGVIEIKCVKYNTHFKRLMEGGYDSSYQWQMRGQMWLYDVDWCDFISYCPDVPLNKRIHIYRVERDLVVEGSMVARLKDFINQVDVYTAILNK